MDFRNYRNRVDFIEDYHAQMAILPLIAITAWLPGSGHDWSSSQDAVSDFISM